MLQEGFYWSTLSHKHRAQRGNAPGFHLVEQVLQKPSTSWMCLSPPCLLKNWTGGSVCSAVAMSLWPSTAICNVGASAAIIYPSCSVAPSKSLGGLVSFSLEVILQKDRNIRIARFTGHLGYSDLAGWAD